MRLQNKKQEKLISKRLTIK